MRVYVYASYVHGFFLVLHKGFYKQTLCQSWNFFVMPPDEQYMRVPPDKDYIHIFIGVVYNACTIIAQLVLCWMMVQKLRSVKPGSELTAQNMVRVAFRSVLLGALLIGLLALAHFLSEAGNLVYLLPFLWVGV